MLTAKETAVLAALFAFLSLSPIPGSSLPPRFLLLVFETPPLITLLRLSATENPLSMDLSRLFCLGAMARQGKAGARIIFNWFTPILQQVACNKAQILQVTNEDVSRQRCVKFREVRLAGASDSFRMLRYLVEGQLGTGYFLGY